MECALLRPGRGDRDLHLADRGRPQGAPVRHIWTHRRAANAASNPDLLRIALKMATGSGKTTVMAMLIAWQTVNAVRAPGSTLWSRGFLLVTPGFAIRDRLRVLLPSDPDSYYHHRELVPMDMLPDIDRAKVVITNDHAFRRRETTEVSKAGRSLLQGRGAAPDTIETEGQILVENIALYGRLGFRATSRVSEKGFDRVYMAKSLD